MSAIPCPSCRHSNPSDAGFCDECGARLEAACPACGTPNRLGAKFCKSCGRALTPAGPSPSPRDYTPLHLAEKILTSRVALEGERKQVTVLFADIQGSLELLRDRDPEEARALLDPALHAMMEAVHRYEGTVNQVLGDGIMALFGAPVAHEDHAVRACYAALAMQVAIRRYADGLQHAHGLDLHVRVGLNSGEVVVRAIGNDLHMDYTAVGQTTHLAGRMEQLAPPGGIRLTAETLRLAEGFVTATPLGPVPVKGLPRPLEVFDLIGAGPTRTRLQAAAARGLTRFVGREAELTMLRRALERAGEGRGQVVALVGEAGVGKSRIFWELTHSAETQGWLTLESGPVAYGTAAPYRPLVDLLRARFRIDDRDDAPGIREKVTGQLFALDRALAPALPALLALLEVPTEDPAWEALDAAQRREQILEAVKRVLLREAQAQPLLLVVEDLHWIDAGSQAVLDRLVESLPTARLLLLISSRPEYQHRWGSQSSYTQLRIDPLPSVSAEALLREILGDHPSLEPLKALLIERTEGNPFFLEESVRALAESRVLAGERGAYRLAQPLQAIQVPATVQAVLAARIDRLPPEEKRLLQAASVIGKDVPRRLLEGIADLPADSLRRGLERLRAADFLYEAALFPDLEYTFRHALTHEVAYGTLLHERRRALHARILESLERLAAGRLAEHVERLAHHAVGGEVWDKAVAYLRQSGVKAGTRFAHREAVVCFEQALTALAHLPESPDTLTRAVDLRFDLRNSLFALGDSRRILEHLRTAEAVAEALGDRSRLGRVHSYLTNYFLATRDHDRAIESGERALALAAAVGDSGLELSTNFYLSQLYADIGEYRRARDCTRRTVTGFTGVSAPKGLGQPAVLLLSRLWLVWCLAELGEFPEGQARAEEAVREAEAFAQPFDWILAYLGLGLLHLRQGALDRAIRALEQGLPLCRSGELSIWFPGMASPLGYAYALSGRLSAALPLLEQAVAETTLRRGAGHALRTTHLGEAYLLAGREEEAARMAAQALELSRGHRERGHQAYALRLLAELAACPDPPVLEPAQTRYQEAIAVADELGMRPLAARCRLGLGALYARLRRPEPARAELAAAVALFEAMGMSAELSRATGLRAIVD